MTKNKEKAYFRPKSAKIAQIEEYGEKMPFLGGVFL